MELYLKRKGEEYAGYPVMSPQMKASAKKWAGNDFIHLKDFNDCLSKCQIYHYVDEANNKVFKVRTKIEDYPVSFTISIEAVTDLLDHGTIEKSLIKDAMVFIDGGRLVLENGKLHRGHLDLKTKMKAPALTEFKRGHLYTRKEGDKYQQYLFLGSTTKYHFVECYGLIEALERPNGYSNLFSVIKPSFRAESGTVDWDLKELLDALIKNTEVWRSSTKWNTEKTKLANKKAIYLDLREKYYGNN